MKGPQAYLSLFVPIHIPVTDGHASNQIIYFYLSIMESKPKSYKIPAGSTIFVQYLKI